jgi:hypothetical protein
MDDKPVGPCGIFCGWCPYYLKGTYEFRCPGCWEKDECPVRDCAREELVSLCTHCKAFPCDNLYKIYPNMGKFLRQIRKDFPEGV